MNDFLNALIYEVKEEVINSYFHERLIIESEIEYYGNQKKELNRLEKQVFLTLNELLEWIPAEAAKKDLTKELLKNNKNPFKHKDTGEYTYLIPKIRGMTIKTRYSKTLLFLYKKLYNAHKDLIEKRDYVNKELNILNQRIVHFQKNYDLMTILSFIRKMDIDVQFKKKFLGYNFNASEMGALEQGLFIKKIPPLTESRFADKIVKPSDMVSIMKYIIKNALKQNKEEIKYHLSKRNC